MCDISVADGMTYDVILDKWYSVVSTDKENWYQALVICESRGQTLMEVHNQQEQDKIQSLGGMYQHRLWHPQM